jgi:hypothetical protein
MQATEFCYRKNLAIWEILNSLSKNPLGVSFRGAKRRGITLLPGFVHREIPRFARNYSFAGIFQRTVKCSVTCSLGDPA